MPTIKLFLLFLAFLGFSSDITAAVRIMPLGDSITQAENGHNSYRRPLWQKLRQANFDVDFVGTFNTLFGGGQPPNADFDLDHQGEWGREAFAVLPKVRKYAEDVRPDIVLLHLGTNDIRSTRFTLAETLDTLGQIIDTLRQVNPSVTVLLATIIPSGDSHAPRLQELAAAIPSLAARKNTAGSPVVLVDQNSGYDGKADNYDDVHPNPRGEEKMAQKWFDALRPVLGGGTAMTLSQVLNGASFASGAVAPGQIVTIFGSGIGPTAPALFRVNAAGLLDISMAETRVLFDSAFAPLIYVSAGQINAIVPYSVIPNSTTRVQIEYRGVRSNVISIPVAPAAPASVPAPPARAAPRASLNENTSVNTPGNPADKNSIAVFYLTGEGVTTPAGVDGKIAKDEFPKPLLPVTVTIGGMAAEVLYAGAAPTYVAGLVQVNARIPIGAPSGDAVPVVVRIGGIASQNGVTMAIR